MDFLGEKTMSRHEKQTKLQPPQNHGTQHLIKTVFKILNKLVLSLNGGAQMHLAS
jgi:hypothetical protein